MSLFQTSNDSVPDQILALYSTHGHLEYGESISVLSHSFQAGMIASEKNLDSEMILAAYLHDIGHLSEKLHDPQFHMSGYGIKNHEILGANLLRNWGASNRLIDCVGYHVDAKRYLCAVDAQYYGKLSLASKNTLAMQGGPMLSAEMQAFESEPYFQEIILIRKIDDLAKEGDFYVQSSHWNDFENLLHTYFDT